MKKEKLKNIVICILTLVIISFIIIFCIKYNDNTKIDRLIRDSIAAQAGVSEYIGKIKSDTFDIYTTEQILIGSTDIANIDSTTIKNNDNEDLLKIVSIEDKISQGKSVYYKINTDNFEQEFNVQLYDKDGIVWYIESTGNIKISYTTKPNWWTEGLNALYLGN